MTSLTQFFSASDYVRALPMLLLTLFALGILLIDLFLPKEWKRINPYIALLGIAFPAVSLAKLQLAYHVAREQGIAFSGRAFPTSGAAASPATTFAPTLSPFGARMYAF